MFISRSNIAYVHICLLLSFFVFFQENLLSLAPFANVSVRRLRPTGFLQTGAKRASAFNETTDGNSAEPASLDVTDKSEPPLSGGMPSWSDDGPSWGTCVTGLFFAPKHAWDVLCTRSLRR